MFSLSPCIRFSRRLSSIFHNSSNATVIILSLVSLLSISSASAQTRNRRTRADDKKVANRAEDKSSARRVEEKKRTAPAEVARRDTPRQVAAPLVRQTALIYAPKVDNQTAAKRPVLVNDITVVSRVSDNPAGLTRSTASTKAVGGPSSIPSIWPVTGSLRSGVGIRSNPFGGSSTEFHKGQDIAAPMGTPVIATADGTIIVAGWQRGYGWVVYIDHGNRITTRYGHLSRIDVEVGQT
ncbi:MAG: M23 family metallopeptidase, partial [Acidobacteria bacterium]|nr:M23 family metallopeptidase [Acidobacteriota bacterium]